ncbi:hypothetical protein M5D96_011202 [Drosophila gunungcola]|uniref:Uncharacterized protein n=1 Tax=Drosophila gunungcola TaxID=103775 RepID=A0A9P9YFQ2_9MUSC|nr:hypothetical protein M5D96_011202 [Drosophila gunungcola]
MKKILTKELKPNLTSRELLQNLSAIIEQHVALVGTKCRQGTCNSFNIHEIGNIVLIGY